MTDYVFAPQQPSSVAVDGSQERYPVRRIICVGRNYAAHAREMGMDPTLDPPFFFYKPTDALVDNGTCVPYPPLTQNLHYEAELVVAINKGGKDISKETALDHVFGYAVGLDLTRRDLQLSLRDKGRPWDWGKGFDQSAPCGPLHRVTDNQLPTSGRIWLEVNGKVQQDANLNDLIWPVASIISIISESIELKQGDLIYTGTPEGVGPVVSGDVIRVGIDGLGDIEISIG